MLVALRIGTDTGLSQIVLAAGDQSQMLVIGYRRVARSARADGELCIGQPLHIAQKPLVTGIPHEAHRSECRPTAVSAETRRTVSAHRSFDKIAVVVAVFPAAEERKVGVSRRTVRPLRGACRGTHVVEQIVALTCRRNAESFAPVTDALLAGHEIEPVQIVDVELVAGRIGDREIEGIRRVA